MTQGWTIVELTKKAGFYKTLGWTIVELTNNGLFTTSQASPGKSVIRCRTTLKRQSRKIAAVGNQLKKHEQIHVTLQCH